MVIVANLLLCLVLFVTIFGAAYCLIVAPSMRRRCQFRVFAIRDRARSALIGGEIDERAYRFIEDRCNVTIQLVEFIDLLVLFRFMKDIEQIPEDRWRKMRKENRELRNVAEVKRSLAELQSILKKSILINSGLTGIVFLGLSLIRRCIEWVKSMNLVKHATGVLNKIVSDLPAADVNVLRHHGHGLIWKPHGV